MSATTTKVWCQDCGHAKALHVLGGKHPCVLDGCVCLRFVSQAEAQEVARSLREQLSDGVKSNP